MPDTSPFLMPERQQFIDSFDRFVAAEIAPYVDAWDEDGKVPWALHEKIGAFGIWGLGVDEAFGGLGFDDAFLRARANERLFGCGASGVAAAVGGRAISIGPLAKFASDAFRKTVLPQIIAGQIGSALAITEPSGGSDVANLQTRATRTGDGWRITGEKAFITGGMTADWFVVGARTGGAGMSGISLFLVPSDAAGFSRLPLERKMGWWCSDQATLIFDDCTVPEDALLGPENRGFLAIMDNFNAERLAMAAGALGMARLCYGASLQWARERETFGQRLIEHQVIAHKFSEMSARIDALSAYVDIICWRTNEGLAPVAEITKAKFLATKTLEFVASESMQVFGGAAYLRGNPVERVWRELKVMAIGGGSEEVMRDLAARQMGLAG